MRERGFAIIGTVVVVALAVALGFGAAVVLGQSHLVATAKRAQSTLSAKSHEKANIVPVERNPDNTEVLVRNDGSTSIVLKKALVEKVDNSLTVYDLEGEVINTLDNSIFTIPVRVENNATLGVLTRLGNVFWEAG